LLYTQPPVFCPIKNGQENGKCVRLKKDVSAGLALKEQGLSAFDLTPEEIQARWPKRLAAWFEKQMRRKV
jgi:hypothetical protein